MATLLLALLLCPAGVASLSVVPAAPLRTSACNRAGRYHPRGGTSALSLARSAAGAHSGGVETDDTPEAQGASDLKSLLPTPRKRTLRLDKFGRRIHDLTDDGTARYAKEPGRGVSATVGYSGSGGEGGSSLSSADDVPAMSSDGSVTSEGASVDAASPSPSLSQLMSEDGDGAAPKSPKAVAADASTAEFGGEVRYSSDLKALLPTRKMRFMKLDKFGRRVQRMEDDGTVHMEKEPRRRPPSPPAPEARADDENFAAAPVEETKEAAPVDSPSLAKILGKGEEGQGNESFLGAGSKSADLKELLPKQKMRFMKLDKFGRRVQRMEDDGTVNFAKEPGKSTGPKIASHRGTQDGFDSDSAASVDLGSSEEASGAPNYGGLKELLPQRPVWTKLDFHGRPVEDERRTKKAAEPVSADDVSSGSGLKDLLPQKAVWTKLDFHGASVIDERRTKKVDKPSSESFNSGGYSSLKTLLPERKIKWRKQGELLSSGSAPTASNVRGLREERQQAMRDEVVASANERTAEEEEEVVEEDGVAEDDAGSSGEAAKEYTNLKSLLPERKIHWRKQGELLSSGSAVTVSENVRGLREERKQ